LAKGGLSAPQRHQDAEEDSLRYRQKGGVVPLRPVSELGLVDVTDLAAPDDNEAKTSSSASKPGTMRAPRSSTARKRPRSSGTGSGSRAQRTAATSRSGATPAASATGSPIRQEPNRSVVTDAGLSLLGGAIGVAGALLIGRSVLRR
jgi:hypothetical protein